MKFLVMFQDNEDLAPMRQKYMLDHLSFLEENRSSVMKAGPLTNADTGENAGGVWVVDAENATDVHNLVKSDPFWPTGLRKSYSVLSWKQVFADGSRLINPAT